MYHLTLPKRYLRVLAKHLPQSVKDFSRQELRRLDRIDDLIDAAAGDYIALVERTLNAAHVEMSAFEAEHQGNLQAIETKKELVTMSINAKSAEIDAAQGSEPATLELEEVLFLLIERCWTATNGFLGGKEVRKFVFAMDEAMELAKKEFADQ